MNIDAAQTTTTNSQSTIKSQSKSSNSSGTSFADELKSGKESADKKAENKKSDTENQDVEGAIDVLKDAVEEINSLNQKEESDKDSLKNSGNFTDNKNKQEDFDLIDNNNIYIQEQTEKLNMQMGAGMNFNSNGQPFSEFINQKDQNKLSYSAKDLAEEQSILSTMEENIAIANKNMALSKNKTVQNEHGIHKVDKNSGIVVDTIVSYDNVIMDKNDVDFFANLVEKGQLNMSEVENAQKSSQVSKTLADLLAKSMNDNKPIRIDFDNNISVIIKIDRAGKISADFLPSSQIAEAYLKENLPLLKQRFDDNNIEYNELNQRQRKQDQEQNRKKDNRNE